MLIDWFTVGAQALNFIILVWLLKRFLYKPILGAVDAREKRIAAELADAASRKAEAQKERDAYEQKNAEFDRQRAALLAKATQEADAERQRLLDEARKAADALAGKRREALQSDAANLNQAIRRRAEQEVFAIARQALADLASTSLEECMVDLFARRLRSMDGKAKLDFGEALKAATEPVVVRSAFDLPDAQRSVVTKALKETFAADIPVRFATSPDLVSGIELTASGQKIGWNVADYLASLEQGVGELVQAKGQPEAEPKAEPEPAPMRKAKSVSSPKAPKPKAAHS